LDKLDEVRAGAAFLTDLDKDDNITGAWAWLIWCTMILKAMIRANDGYMRLMTYTGNSIVCHNRLVSTYQSRIDKYRRRGVRIFDEIEVDPEMLNTRAFLLT